jgi:hypothetical protein
LLELQERINDQESIENDLNSLCVEAEEMKAIIGTHRIEITALERTKGKLEEEVTLKNKLNNHNLIPLLHEQMSVYNEKMLKGVLDSNLLITMAKHLLFVYPSHSNNHSVIANLLLNIRKNNFERARCEASIKSPTDTYDVPLDSESAQKHKDLIISAGATIVTHISRLSLGNDNQTKKPNHKEDLFQNEIS